MASDRPSARVIRCPACSRSTRFDTSNPYRPFCSERCKTNDIANWAEESYRIPVQGQDTSEDEVLSSEEDQE